METLTVAGSQVLVGAGLLASPLPPRSDRSGTVIFTQPGARDVAESVAARLEAPVRVFPDGERAKTLAVAAGAYRWLDDIGLDRRGTVVVVGGGTVCDVGGFVASTYLRGIEVVSVPTTLLAAVDAAIGGKTAVNLEAKNQIGTFWEPSRILVDLDVLGSLPHRLVREGMAEIAKAGMVGDERLVIELEEHGLQAPLVKIVPAAIRVKAKIVTEDLRERGIRTVLNYGHTVGHAVERVAGISHGESVSIGMTAAAHIAESLLGFDQADRQLALLEGLELPTTCTVDLAEVTFMLRKDKKRDGSGIRMVLLRAVGCPVVTPVDKATLSSALSDTLR
ncbi:MAG TPA: iron-containing alcohol dehydrogenase [Actinobacteria bacterium]|nr:3-dehydroquinate synthase [bacterium BMS3Bbin01]HDH25701.1 iron-containing alcohol dehydrogenase [Actinomycetota bacterium]